jgi:hypothetical protein
LLIAQIAASLASVPGVFSVRVLVEDRSYAGGAVPVSVAVPLMATSKGPALAISAAARLVSLTGTTAAAVGWVGRDHGAEPLLGYPVASPSGDRLAALRNAASGAELTVADLGGGSQLTATERAEIPLPQQVTGSYLGPQWLDDERILLASAGARPAVQLVDARHPKLRPVATPGLAALGPLSAFAVSRDGTRVIAVAGQPGARQLYLGRITPAAGSADGVLTVGGWTQVPTGLADVAAASWSADLAATVVGKPATLGSAPRAEIVALDTVSDPTALPALPTALSAADPVSPLQIAAAPGRATLLSADGHTWMLQNAKWLPVGTMAGAGYP